MAVATKASSCEGNYYSTKDLTSHPRKTSHPSIRLAAARRIPMAMSQFTTRPPILVRASLTGDCTADREGSCISPEQSDPSLLFKRLTEQLVAGLDEPPETSLHAAFPQTASVIVRNQMTSHLFPKALLLGGSFSKVGGRPARTDPLILFRSQ